jgi:hypothetical protein
MDPYIFHGKVLPERAQLSLAFSVRFSHMSSGVSGHAKVSIILNQIAVWVDSDHDWDIHTLRNVVLNIVHTNLAMIGYLKGYAYDCEITRAVNRERGIDYVFGINVPCLTNRIRADAFDEALVKIRAKVEGSNGLYLQRCFNDLVSAIRYADDTGFYCYRAIESLRHHCAAIHGLLDAPKAQQWDKFRATSATSKEILRGIKAEADPARHGDMAWLPAVDREQLFKATWGIIDRYLGVQYSESGDTEKLAPEVAPPRVG